MIDQTKLADALDGIYCTLMDLRALASGKHGVYIEYYLSDLDDFVDELREND